MVPNSAGRERSQTVGTYATFPKQWAEMAAGPPLHVETVQRTILGRQVGFLHETVTLKAIDASRTEVHVAVRDLREPVAAQPRLPIVLPRSLSWLSVVEQGAGRGAAQTVSLSSRVAVSHTVTAFATALRAAGWSLSPAFRAPSQRGVVLWATREDEHILRQGLRGSPHTGPFVHTPFSKQQQHTSTCTPGRFA